MEAMNSGRVDSNDGGSSSPGHASNHAAGHDSLAVDVTSRDIERTPPKLDNLSSGRISSNDAPFPAAPAAHELAPTKRVAANAAGVSKSYQRPQVRARHPALCRATRELPSLTTVVCGGWLTVHGTDCDGGQAGCGELRVLRPPRLSAAATQGRGRQRADVAVAVAAPSADPSAGAAGRCCAAAGAVLPRVDVAPALRLEGQLEGRPHRGRHRGLHDRSSGAHGARRRTTPRISTPGLGLGLHVRACAVLIVPVGVRVGRQAMAYANIAALPDVYGLYAALIPIYVYAIFGTSRQLAVGPVALISLLVTPLVARGGVQAA
eukprot:scaffold4756_cov357-Prasinococcus_capsulatus_cf.AAC.5